MTVKAYTDYVCKNYAYTEFGAVVLWKERQKYLLITHSFFHCLLIATAHEEVCYNQNQNRLKSQQNRSSANSSQAMRYKIKADRLSLAAAPTTLR